MIRNNEDLARHIVPRWRTICETIESGELSSHKTPQIVSTSTALHQIVGNSEYSRKLELWEYERSTAAAEELIATAIVLGISDKKLHETAQQIISDPLALSGSKRMALGFIGINKEGNNSVASYETEIRAKAQLNKRALSFAPRDSLLLTETALILTMLGPSKSAKNMIRRAVALTPINRYVFRSAIRFLIHIGCADEAIDLAKKNPAIKQDPWLMSAGLSAADALGEAPVFWGEARHLLSDKGFSTFDLSELASAVATAHMTAGSHKLARKTFKQSLENPTENAVAQAEWAHRIDGAIQIPEKALSVPHAFEAKALQSYKEHNWANSLDEALKWGKLEPFNPSPFIHASMVSASLTDQFDIAIDATKKGLLANPNTPTLLNNLAVAHAYRGDISDAEGALAHARKNSKAPSNDITLNATAGLVAFRKGEAENGVNFYVKAIECATTQGLFRERLRALSYLAKEVAAFDQPLAKDIIDAVNRDCEFLKDAGREIPPDVIFLIGKIKSSPILALGDGLSEPVKNLVNNRLVGS